MTGTVQAPPHELTAGALLIKPIEAGIGPVHPDKTHLR
jgi:hypothetical protein